jgi:hypothetical protein
MNEPKRTNKYLAVLGISFAFLSFTGISSAHAATINVNSSMSTGAIQSAINTAAQGSTINFTAGTYNITAGLTVPCGITLSAAVPATPSNVILSASFSRESADIFKINSGCTAATTISWLSSLHAGLLFVSTPNSNLTITHNQVGDLPCCSNLAYDSGIFINDSASNVANVLSNATITWNTIGDSTSCTSPQNAMTDTNSPEDIQPNCTGLFVQTSVNGLVVENNNFLHVSEGVHIQCFGSNCSPGDSPSGPVTKNITAEFNDFNQIHRIPWEEQPEAVSGVIFQYNTIHDWTNPYFGSFGVSFACCANPASAAPYTNVSNNVITQNLTPAGEYGYGMEAWGVGSIYNNNLVEIGNYTSGGGGIAWGLNGVPSIAHSTSYNTVCGPGFAVSGYVHDEGYGVTPQPTQVGNVTGSSCPTETSAAPTISSTAGTVTLSDPGYTSGSQPLGNTSIYYTTDGSTPTTNSTFYSSPFNVSAGTVVKAIGMWGAQNQPKSYPAGYGFTPSAVVSATVTTGSSSPTPTPTPTPTPSPIPGPVGAAGSPASASNLTLQSPSSNSMVLSWTGSTGATGYLVMRKATQTTDPFVQVVSLPTGSTGYLDTNLNYTWQYDYEIIAYNASGQASPSNIATYQVLGQDPGASAPSTPVIPPTTPTAPSTPTQPTGGPVPPTTPAQSINPTTPTTPPGNLNTITEEQITAMTPAQLYALLSEIIALLVQDLAQLSGGIASPTTGPIVPTAVNTAGSPASVTNLTLQSPAQNAMVLSWTGSSGATGYLVMRRPTWLPLPNPFVQIVNLPTGSTGYFDTGLNYPWQYDYEVIAYNGTAQASPSNSVTYQVLGQDPKAAAAYVPGAPTNLSLQSPTQNSMVLNWTDNDPNATSYLVMRRPTHLQDPNPLVQVIELPAGSTGYTDTSLNYTWQYDYQIIAIDANGQNRPSSVSTYQVLGQNPNATAPANPAGPVTTAPSTPSTPTTPGTPTTPTTPTSPSTTSTGSTPAPSGVPSAPTNVILKSPSNTATVISWTGVSGATSYIIMRRTTNGGDAFAQVASVTSGVTSYLDNGLNYAWQYDYEVIAVNAAGQSVPSSIITVSVLGQNPGATASAGGTAPSTPSSPTSPSSPSTPSTPTGGFNPITDVTAGATIVHPGDNIAAIVQACSTGVVHFAAGTYTLTSSMNVPSNCTLEGELGWTSIITGGVGNSQRPIFQLNHSSNVTIDRLNFQNVNSQAISNYGGSGSGNIVGTHIYLNLFDHFGNNSPMWLWDPYNVTVERNAFNDIGGDGMHFYSSSPGGYTDYPSSNVTVRWNFGSNLSEVPGCATCNVGGGFIEIQLGALGLHVYQNVIYSQKNWASMAESIASGNTPCTPANKCSPPDNGKNGIFIDGNIVLDNGVPKLTSIGQPWGAIEVMGTNPILQNNFFRGWASDFFYDWIFSYNASTNTYGSNGTITMTNNTSCGSLVGSVAGMAGPEDGSAVVPTVSSGNTYSANCANIAPPALYPQVVVAPELLDSSGGMNAIVNSQIPGPNTYWPNVNANLNYTSL